MSKTFDKSSFSIKKYNCLESIEHNLSENDIEDILIEFIWTFNGSNNAMFLIENHNFKYLDFLYQKYTGEIDKMIKYYELETIIEESTYIHSWFNNWKKLEIFTKDQFLNKLKIDQEFSDIWADMGYNDSLELRNWGIEIQYDAEDKASLKSKGKDQIHSVINSLLLNPTSGTHFINFFNPNNIQERFLKSNYFSVQFSVHELEYEERIKWFFTNYYETGMEYEILLDTMKKQNLDKIKHYDQIISLPKYLINSFNFFNRFDNEFEKFKAIIFSDLLLKTLASYTNMIPNNYEILSNSVIKPRKIKNLQKIYLKLNKKTKDTIKIDRNEIITSI